MAWTEIVASGGVAIASGTVVAVIADWRERVRQREDRRLSREGADNARVLALAQHAFEVATLTQTIAMEALVQQGGAPSHTDQGDRSARRHDFDTAQQQVRLLEREIRLLGPIDAVGAAQDLVIKVGRPLGALSRVPTLGVPISRDEYRAIVDMTGEIRSAIDQLLAFRTGVARPISGGKE